jgi:hypothetical protein
MCVKKGENVLVMADTGTDMTAVHAILDAGYRAGAKTSVMVLAPQLPFQGSIADQFLPAHATAAIDACDVCIDLCMPYLAGSKAYDKAMHNKRTRYFLGADMGMEELVRLMGGARLDDVFALSNAIAELVAESKGKECRFTNPAGSDFTCVIAETEGLAFARATAPGGYFVPGTALIIPELESVKGTIVGKTCFHEYYTEFSEPLTFKVDGKVRDVIGGGQDNKVMRRSLERAGNGEFGYVVHLTCGHHPAARYTGKCFIEDQRVTGNNAIGLGLPPWIEGGGENHPDVVMDAQTIWIGGKEIVKDGLIVGPPALAKLASALTPLYG